MYLTVCMYVNIHVCMRVWVRACARVCINVLTLNEQLTYMLSIHVGHVGTCHFGTHCISPHPHSLARALTARTHK